MHNAEHNQAQPQPEEPVTRQPEGAKLTKPPSDSPRNDPLARASHRIRSVDAAGAEATDNTVDTDGKGLEAAKSPSQWQDNVIYSNASLDNSRPEPDPAAPIAGVDSRPSQGRPTIAVQPGQRVVMRGVVDETARNGTRAAQRFSVEEDEQP
ncbi:DUF3005 domain-containing protein [Ralstonia pickettii]|uniref:DUF3005 domain-containing protein n=1 Tax=Ralstonia pickettii TaxID=329 RepID=UPI0015FCBB07|nr:DUF3005 domain-containing protein [Ralstonia pickettii]MBB0022534.1 DUF3005 domain-containing protein [Ralstonia pickettii]MBB0032766.1 DUF3005 domain-containing protein [Ralstonia pickettii]MBB0095762.1 DUF3005 domain-containing protein [Ralstonia pickettii]MBB0105234.1 DUF3005 domain-containing protein [Ralstonia pickettii]MBB0127203.1 DUF3005 domain-containing protein [Ralstonia pickettii]